MPHFDALRNAYTDWAAVIDNCREKHEILTAEAVKAVYNKHFPPDAFHVTNVMSRPQYSPELYPSLFHELPILRGGHGLAGVLPEWGAWTTVVDQAANSLLAKVLLAFVWKQGDLGTVGHVIAGIQNQPIPEQSVVMHQFGRHLADPLNNPIFDQHTYRAFRLLNKMASWERRSGFLKIPRHKTITKPAQREDYLSWWGAELEPVFPPVSQATERQEVMLWTDRLLFSLGKAAILESEELLSLIKKANLSKNQKSDDDCLRQLITSTPAKPARP